MKPATAICPGKKLDFHCTGGWEVPTIGLERCEKSRRNRVSIQEVRGIVEEFCQKGSLQKM
jgi:hypothetical protein